MSNRELLNHPGIFHIIKHFELRLQVYGCGFLLYYLLCSPQGIFVLVSRQRKSICDHSNQGNINNLDYSPTSIEVIRLFCYCVGLEIKY